MPWWQHNKHYRGYYYFRIPILLFNARDVEIVTIPSDSHLLSEVLRIKQPSHVPSRSSPYRHILHVNDIPSYVSVVSTFANIARFKHEMRQSIKRACAGRGVTSLSRYVYETRGYDAISVAPADRCLDERRQSVTVIIGNARRRNPLFR